MVTYAYLKLVRWPILLLIGIIQYSVRYFIMEPMLMVNGYELIMSNNEFAYLVLATILMAAGGYAINDYFDAKIDRINKSTTVVLERIIPRRMAMLLHIVLTSIGFLLACYLSYTMGMWRMSALFIFAVFALWFYSTNLKHMLLAGNLTIAVLSGFVPLIVGLFEIPLQNMAHPESVQELGFSIFNIQAYWILCYSAILATLTLAREISKDIIDQRGDRIYGSTTIPIAWGVKNSKLILFGIYFILLCSLTYAYLVVLQQHEWYVGLIYILIVIGLLIQPIVIFIAKTKKQFLYSVNLNNLITVLLVFGLFAIKVSIANHYNF